MLLMCHSHVSFIHGASSKGISDSWPWRASHELEGVLVKVAQMVA